MLAPKTVRDAGTRARVETSVASTTRSTGRSRATRMWSASAALRNSSTMVWTIASEETERDIPWSIRVSPASRAARREARRRLNSICVHVPTPTARTHANSIRTSGSPGLRIRLKTRNAPSRARMPYIVRRTRRRSVRSNASVALDVLGVPRRLVSLSCSCFCSTIATADEHRWLYVARIPRSFVRVGERDVWLCQLVAHLAEPALEAPEACLLLLRQDLPPALDCTVTEQADARVPRPARYDMRS